jgi:hypothetical protein
MIEGWNQVTEQFIAKHHTWKFDVERLQQDLKIAKTMGEFDTTQDGGLYGMAITGREDDLASGFEFKVGIQDPPYSEQDMTDPDPVVRFDLDFAREHKIYHMLDYDKPTRLCFGYFKEIIDFLESQNIKCRRARLSWMGNFGKISPHTDGNFFRLHIPIVTNNSLFIHGDIPYKLDPGYCYIANVHKYHWVENDSEQERWHIVADCWDIGNNFDIGGITQEHYEQELENARLWREYVDGERDNEPRQILIGAKNT